MCVRCSAGTPEDEFHVVFAWDAYNDLRSSSGLCFERGVKAWSSPPQIQRPCLHAVGSGVTITTLDSPHRVQKQPAPMIAGSSGILACKSRWPLHRRRPMPAIALSLCIYWYARAHPRRPLNLLFIRPRHPRWVQEQGLKMLEMLDQQQGRITRALLPLALSFDGDGATRSYWSASVRV